MFNLPTAPLEWREGVPRHRLYDDHYFSDHNGLAETRYIYLQCNGLPQRWQGVDQFTVGEIGFGTGLNFLATVDLWLRQGPPNAVLHYFSVDKYRVAPTDVRTTLLPWPELGDVMEHWLARFPEPVNGFHRRELWQGRVILTLAYGEAADCLSALRGSIDAWYLDGFAPERNADAWHDTVLAQVARLSREHTTLASFTVAGKIRRCLASHGFALTKVPGFGNKREMLTGRFTRVARFNSSAPWFHYAASRVPLDAPVIVIGAGVAGLSAAWHLAMRGRHVQLLDTETTLATGASGNRAGLVMPRLSRDGGLETRFYLSAFLHAVHQFQALADKYADFLWHGTGLVQMLPSAQAQALLNLGLPDSLLRELDQATASQHAGLGLASGGLLHPAGGWLDPAALCRCLLHDQAGRITVRTQARVSHLTRDNSKWSVQCHDGACHVADVVVLANGIGAGDFMPQHYSTLTASRGQVSYLPARALPGSLRLPVCGNGYITPAGQGGEYCIGASYHADDLTCTLRNSDHEANFQQAQTLFSGPLGAPEHWQGRAAIRATTLDHLPLVGPMPDWQTWAVDYQDLRHGKAPHCYPLATYQPGLFISSGHGSRGIVSSVLAGALLADYLDDSPRCLPSDVVAALHPGRFLIRAARRGTLVQYPANNQAHKGNV